MHGSTDREPEEPRTDGGEAVGGGDRPESSPSSDSSRRVTTWELVPAAGEGTVPVRWTDLKTMRARIDELECEVDRLETELDRSRKRRRRAVERYEGLLDRGGAWGHSVPRAPETDGSEADTGAAGDEDHGDCEDREGGKPAPAGPLGRVLAAVGAVLGRH